MVSAYVILAGFALLVLLGFMCLWLLHSFMQMARRHLIHDLNNSLALASMSHHNGRADGVEAGINGAIAMLSSDETIENFRVARVVASMAHWAHKMNGVPVEPSLDYTLTMTIRTKPLFVCLKNLLDNACEAARRVSEDAPVKVELTATGLAIINPATKRDLRHVSSEHGATSKAGFGHGVGRSAAALACESLGWRLRYTIDGDCVVTCLTWPRGSAC